MERDSIDFPRRSRRLAGRAGVELSERTTREDAQRKRLREALDAAIAFYHRVLTESRHGQPALDYLRGRGFTDETIEHLPAGLRSRLPGTPHPRAHREAQISRGGAGGRRPRHPPPARRASTTASAAGSSSPSATRPATRPGSAGRVLGYRRRERRRRHAIAAPSTSTRRPRCCSTRAARCISSTGPRAPSEAGRAVLVEGNTDALMAHQQGFENVVGTLGTALTAGPGRARHALRATHRAGVRRRCRRPGRGHVRRDGAVRARRARSSAARTRAA